MTFFDMPSGQAPQPTSTLDDDTKITSNDDEWEDEHIGTPMEDRQQLITSARNTKQHKKSFTDRLHLSSSNSIHRPKRVKSRGRQRGQNPRAGIKLITDFSNFRKPSHQQQQQQQQQKASPNMAKTKFVDLAALRALEGSPNSASTGSWNWLKRQKSGASPNHLAPSPADVGLSPADRPIMIGIDQQFLGGKEISPQTAVVETSTGLPRLQTNAVSPTSTAKTTTPATPSQLRSVWSPDTPASASTIDLETRRGTSSIYSHATGTSASAGVNTGVPPVPEVPANFKTGSGTRDPMSAVSEEVDTGTPCTLFEEDGTPTPVKGRQRQRSLASKNFKQSVISDTIPEWWDEDSDIQSPATTAPGSSRHQLVGMQTPTNMPEVQPSRAQQVNITNISVTAATVVAISRPETDRSGAPTPIIGAASTPRPTRELSREPAVAQGAFWEESRDGPRTRAARTPSDASDAVTEILDDEQVSAEQANTTINTGESSSRSQRNLIGIAISPSSPVASPGYPQRSFTQQQETTQRTNFNGLVQPSQFASSREARGDDLPLRSAAEVSSSAEPQFPPRSESFIPVAWPSPLRPNPPRTRSESPARTASPARGQTSERAPSPAWSQSQGRNHSPARGGTPRLALGAATMSSSDRGSPRRTETRADQARVLAEENEFAGDEPPPYSPPRRNLQAPTRFRALFPPDHPLHSRFPPSPGPASPAMADTMTSQGAVNMTEIPLTPGPPPAGSREGRGGFVPAEHYGAVESRQDRVERRRLEEERKQLEKERKREEGDGPGGILKMAWRLRNLFPRNQNTAAAAAPPAEPKKPIWPWVTAGAVALIILAAVLAGTLTRKGGSDSGDGKDDDVFVNYPGFPPMPTGVLTVVGPENSRSDDQCTQPSSLWSCELPKELHDSVAPYKPNQPTVVMQIQFDDTSRKSWDVSNGDPPVPKPKLEDDKDKRNEDISKLRRSSTLGRRLRKRLAQGISPDPAPPSFEEMYFLGNTTDGIVSDDKAGEPTPFYISLLQSTDDSAGPNRIQKRLGVDVPDPELDKDGTGAPARLLPEAKQQPVRLYDRGLPSEHYGFYTYFPRTIYLRSVSANDTNAVRADQDGGAPKDEAKFIVTWSETRFLVKLWTNSEDSKLLSKNKEGGIEDKEEMTRPGTMPYPVTMQLDTHGGTSGSKFVWQREVKDGKINAKDHKFLVNDIGAGGEVVNPRSNKNLSFGGVDGGVGGCGCEWVNFAER